MSLRASRKQLEPAELDDELFFEFSQRNSERLDIDDKRLSAQGSDLGSLRPSENGGAFPDKEFLDFKRQRKRELALERLAKSYSDKHVSAFYLIWDNVQFCHISNLVTMFARKRLNYFRLFKMVIQAKRKFRTKPEKKRFILRSERYQHRGMNRASGAPEGERVEIPQSPQARFAGTFGSLHAKAKDEDYRQYQISVENANFQNLERQHFERSENLNLMNLKAQKNVFLESDDNVKSQLKKMPSYPRDLDRRGKQVARGAKRRFHKPGTRMRRLRQALEREELETMNAQIRQRSEREIRPGQGGFFKKKRPNQYYLEKKNANRFFSNGPVQPTL